MERPETRVHRLGPFPVRFRELEVIRTQPLGPHLMRVTLGGPDLEGFRTLGPDDHVKLCFPSATGELVVPRPGPGGLTWPEGHEKPPLRDYTPRQFDPVRGELDIDFVMHGDGPAASWARRCQNGDRLGVGGPRGSMTLVPGAFDGFVLLGDMTALPAIFRRIEEAPLALPIVAVIEVDTEADELPVETRALLSLRWVHRRGAPAGGSPLLVEAARTLALPAGDLFAWVAGESGVTRAVRDALLERGIRKKWMRASGYWKQGVADHHD